MTWDEAAKSIKRSDLPVLRMALENGLDANLCNRFGWTLLMCAALEGVAAVGRLLLEAGADCDRTNQSGANALGLAVHNAHPEFVQMLLEKGASLEPLGDWRSHREWLLRHSNNTATTLARIYKSLEDAYVRSGAVN